MTVNNAAEANYSQIISQIGQKLLTWDGPIVLVSHVDPDGDALGSTLSLKRALDALGKQTVFPMEVPRYLQFLGEDGEISKPLESLPEACLLIILDVSDTARVDGAPLDGAAYSINIDHHGTNNRFGDLSLVDPSKAATAQMVKDLIDDLVANSDLEWTSEIATPCLTGIMTDTGNFRYGNTSPDVLHTAADLIAKGVDYTSLADRLQWRHPDYFKMLGMVMSTVDFHFDGQVVTARMTEAMTDELGETDDDSNDYVGLIRYAEGVKIAVFLREREDVTKVSVRTRDGVSAQAMCMELGGGGHVAAAGAKLGMGLDEAQTRVLEAAKNELVRQDLI